mmetsp:Transcript_56091/g.177743  ORF Transcript_56091/g.177743 Transcript_56091/m.177743 type:complete len:157 (+) Transcript_56091:96-566(+)
MPGGDGTSAPDSPMGVVSPDAVDITFFPSQETTQKPTTPSASAAKCHVLTPGTEVPKGKAYSGAVDLWSAGVLLYMLLAGRPPFWVDKQGPEARRELFDSIMAANPALEGGEWDEVSASAKDLIRRLLNPDPALRMTAEQALAHPWITNGPKSYMG